MDNLVDNVTLNDPRVKIRVRVKKGQNSAALTRNMTLTLPPFYSRGRVKGQGQGRDAGVEGVDLSTQTL